MRGRVLTGHDVGSEKSKTGRGNGFHRAWSNRISVSFLHSPDPKERLMALRVGNLDVLPPWVALDHKGGKLQSNRTEEMSQRGRGVLFCRIRADRAVSSLLWGPWRRVAARVTQSVLAARTICVAYAP